MADIRPSVPLEALLAHREWVRSLARRLVSDENSADDIEQQTWLTAIERPPSHATSLRGWLGTVVRTAARKARRGEVRRTFHEGSVRSRAGGPTGADLAAEAETQQVLVRAILALDEPYRSTVLHRWFDGLPPRGIAVRMGVPVETVRTRLRRAHDRLREWMDEASDGDRRAWSLAVLAWPEPAKAPSLPCFPVVAGVLAMSGAKKAAIAIVVLLAAGLATWQGAENATREERATAPHAEGHAAVPTTAARGKRAGEPVAAVDSSALQTSTRKDEGTAEVSVRTMGGVPVTGAEVEVFVHDPWALNALFGEVASRVQDPLPPAMTARTDSAGHVRVSHLRTDVDATFVVRKEGFAVAGVRRYGNTPGRAAALDVLLVPGYGLSGRVVDKAGRAVPGAHVIAGGPRERSAPNTGGSPTLIRATADADGRFALAGLERGPVLLWAAWPHGPAARVAVAEVPAPREVDLVLGGPAIVEGTVRDASSSVPIPGAIVTLEQSDAQGYVAAATTANGEGRYRFEGVPVTEALLRARAAGYVAGAVGELPDPRVRIASGATTTCDVSLRRGTPLSGTVRGPDGPVPGARVTAVRDGTWNQKTAVTMTDVDGRYRIDAVVPGRTVVVVSVEGWFQEGFASDWTRVVGTGKAPEEAVVTVPETGEATRDILLTRGLEVSGRVVLADDSPGAGAWVTLLYDAGATSYGPWVFQKTTTDAAGAFRFRGVAPEHSAKVHAGIEGCAATSVSVDLVPRKGAEGVTLHLGAVATLRGQVTGPEAADLQGAWVEVAFGGASGDPGAQQWAWAQSLRVPIAANGTFTTAIPYATISLDVRAVAPSFPPSPPISVSVSPQRRDYEANLVLAPGQVVRGCVVAQGSSVPVAGARVTLEPAGRRMSQGYPAITPVAAVTGVDGKFALRDLGEGRYTVAARADGFLAGSAELTVPREGELVLEMPRSVAICGRARLSDGTPAVGVQVTAYRPGTGGVITPVESDASGVFRVDGLVAAGHLLQFASRNPPRPGDAVVRRLSRNDVLPSETPLEVTLEGALAIAGRVTDDAGKGVPLVWVSCEPLERDPDAPSGGYVAVSRTDGAFAVVGLLAGEHTLTARPQGARGGIAFAPVEVRGVRAGDMGVAVVLKEGLVVSGTVVDEQGRSVSGMVVEARPADARDGPAFTYSSTIRPACDLDAAGRFRIGGLSPGRYRLCLVTSERHPTALQPDGSGLVTAGQTDVRVVATSASTISGNLTGEQDRGFINVRVVARAVGGGDEAWATTLESGAFVFVDLTPGRTYDVEALYPGMVPARSGAVAAGSRSVRLRLERGLVVRGRLIDAAGAPLSKANLRFRGVSNTITQDTATGDDGTFEVSGLLSGEYAVKADIPVAQRNGGIDDPSWRACGSVRAGEENAVLRLVK